MAIGAIKDLPLKATALLLALFLKVYFHSPTNSSSVDLVTAVEVRNLAPSMVIVEPRGIDKGLFARVKVEGPHYLVDHIKNETFRIVLDFGSEGPGSFTKELNPDGLSLPVGVHVVGVYPPRLDFQVDKLMRREVKVAVRSAGEISRDGLTLQRVVPVPGEVAVIGPSSEVQRLTEVDTETVAVSDIHSSAPTVDVPLAAPTGYLRYGVNTVRAEFFFGGEVGERQFQQVKVDVRAPRGYAATAYPSSVTAIVKGSPRVLEGLQQGTMSVVADASSLSMGKHDVKVSGNLPSGVELVRTEPATVAVTLAKTGGS